MERWNLEPDLLNLAIVKINDGNEGWMQFAMCDNFRIELFRN